MFSGMPKWMSELYKKSQQMRLSFDLSQQGLKPDRGAGALNNFLTELEHLNGVITQEQSEARDVFGLIVETTVAMRPPNDWQSFIRLVGTVRKATGEMVTHDEIPDEVEIKSMARIHDACDKFLIVSRAVDPRVFKVLNNRVGMPVVLEHLQLLMREGVQITIMPRAQFERTKQDAPGADLL